MYLEDLACLPSALDMINMINIFGFACNICISITQQIMIVVCIPILHFTTTRHDIQTDTGGEYSGCPRFKSTKSTEK